MGNLNVTGKGTLNGNPMASFPIGSIYLSYNNTSPASLFGGNWEPIEADRTLWTTTTAGQGGTPISAGLPNIKGYFNCYSYNTTGEGCFSVKQNGGGPSTGGSNKWNGVNFDASYQKDGNNPYNIYRYDVTTVQPPAIKIYAWHRVAYQGDNMSNLKINGNINITGGGARW